MQQWVVQTVFDVRSFRLKDLVTTGGISYSHHLVKPNKVLIINRIQFHPMVKTTTQLPPKPTPIVF